jgi:hypothetical protein
MTSEISSAQSISGLVETKVLALQPSDYNSNKQVLLTYYGQLKTAHNDNMTAYSDAKTMLTSLESQKQSTK